MYIFITETPKYYYTSLSTLFIPCKILFNIFAYLELQSQLVNIYIYIISALKKRTKNKNKFHKNKDKDVPILTC